MNKIGFIGYGSMARMLIDGFLSSKVITPNQVIVSTRSKEKLEVLSTKWAGIRLAKDNKAVAHESKILFLCVKPLEILPVLVEIKDSLHADTHLVSMAVGVTLGDLQAFFNGRVTKLIPVLPQKFKKESHWFATMTRFRRMIYKQLRVC